MATAIENSAGIGRIWTQLSKTRRGWEKYSHSYPILGGFRGDEVRIFHILIEDGKQESRANSVLGKDWIRPACVFHKLGGFLKAPNLRIQILRCRG